MMAIIKGLSLTWEDGALTMPFYKHFFLFSFLAKKLQNYFQGKEKWLSKCISKIQ